MMENGSRHRYLYLNLAGLILNLTFHWLFQLHSFIAYYSILILADRFRILKRTVAWTKLYYSLCPWPMLDSHKVLVTTLVWRLPCTIWIESMHFLHSLKNKLALTPFCMDSVLISLLSFSFWRLIQNVSWDNGSSVPKWQLLVLAS